MIVKLYRKIVPATVRKKIYKGFLESILFFIPTYPLIPKAKAARYFGFLLPKTEKNEAYAFIGKNGLTFYPFKTSVDYYALDVTVYADIAVGLNYVLHNGEKLFFPSNWAEERIKTSYIGLLIEQDIFSPHRYVEEYSELRGRTLLDIGAAEGIFSLDTIEFTKEVYLFECEDPWIKALEATFAPWKDKVHIVKRYVGNIVNDSCVTIDSFFKFGTGEPLFLKMDIEGAEISALQGAHVTLTKSNDVVMSVCTYHRENDAKDIEALLKAIGYNVNFTNKYICHEYKYVRKCLIRANRMKNY